MRLYRKFVTLSLCLVMSTMLLAGCKDRNEDWRDIQDDIYRAEFNVDTGDSVAVSVDEGGRYQLVKQDDGFLLKSVSKGDTEVASSVTGVFLSGTVANQTSAELRKDESYETATVDGKSGYRFAKENQEGVMTYVCIVPCGDESDTYVELFSTVSEKELTDAMADVHVSVLG